MLLSVFSESGFVKYALSPKGSPACLAERFSAKNGDPPGAGKFWDNRLFTGKMDHYDHENPKVDETTCQGPGTLAYGFSVECVRIFFQSLLWVWVWEWGWRRWSGGAGVEALAGGVSR